MSVERLYLFFGRLSLPLFIAVCLLSMGNIFLFGPPPQGGSMFIEGSLLQITFNAIALVWISTGTLCGGFFIMKKIKKENVVYYPATWIPFAIGIFIGLAVLAQLLMSSLA